MSRTRPHPRPRTIWLINLFFGAGPAPTGALAESLAVALERHGFQVEVLAGRSTYNAGPQGSAGQRFTGRVHRLYSRPARVRGVLGRLLSWLSFYLAVAGFVFSCRLPARVVLLTTPPLLHAVLALLDERLRDIENGLKTVTRPPT